MNARKRVIGIALLTALSVVGDSMLFIVLPIYWEDFGLTAVWQIGVLLSVNRFVRLPINPLIGLFYKHFQLRTGLYIAVFLAISTTFSYGVVKEFWLLFFMRALWGVAWSLLRLGGYLTVIEFTEQMNRGKFVGLYNGLWGLGGLVGMLGGGLLVDQTSLFFVTTLFALLGLLAIPMVVLFVPVSQPNTEIKPTTGTKVNGFSTYIWLVLATGFTMGFVVFGLFASTLSQLINNNYSNEWTIMEFTVGAATIAGIIQAIRWGWDPFIASAIGRRLDIASSQIRILYIPLLGGGLLLLILGFLQSIILLIVSLLLFQLMSTLFVTTTDTLATNTAGNSSNSIKVITAHTIVIDVGAAVGPFMSYVVIQYFNLITVYIMASALMTGLALIWYIYNRYTFKKSYNLI
ncbi:MFS transporter [Virgibacillus byunsanensis]|uniref:MFS transporter n=1 Tax=Virgibacillus byunsanensis TaxID=570945 RepID=A0ABW3LK67_9BACI